MSQLTMKKQKFTTEVHLSKDDPNYGKPLEGDKRPHEWGVESCLFALFFLEPVSFGVRKIASIVFAAVSLSLFAVEQFIKRNKVNTALYYRVLANKGR